MISEKRQLGRHEPRIDPIEISESERGAAARLLKRAILAIAVLWILPRLLAYRIAGEIWGREQAFQAASESIARLPGRRGVYCRQAFYRRTLASCGRDVYLGWLSTFSKSRATVGEGAYIGNRCGIGLADIGAEVMLADGVQLLSGRHQHEVTTGESHKQGPRRFDRVAIGDGAWLGTNAIIMADVGAGAVIGAGSVVVDPVPPRTVAVGVPARVVKHLSLP